MYARSLYQNMVTPKVPEIQVRTKVEFFTEKKSEEKACKLDEKK